MELDVIRSADPAIADAIEAELERQRTHIELIASENFVSPAVMAAMGSCLTNKYAEGYPAKRYYGGCECVDVAENLARDRAKQLFGCEYVNVQPHSGAQANMAVYFACLNPGDTVMGMALDNGGHLTHGSPVNMSGKYFNFVSYGVNADGYIDYDDVLAKAKACQPKLIVAGASAYPRRIDFAKLRAICDEVGALMMVDIAHIAGLVAAGEHPSPVFDSDLWLAVKNSASVISSPSHSFLMRLMRSSRRFGLIMLYTLEGVTPESVASSLSAIARSLHSSLNRMTTASFTYIGNTSDVRIF